MSKVIFYMSMSLDGFVTGADVTKEEGLGRGGERLHEWTGDPKAVGLIEGIVQSTGAVIVGRRTYDLSRWGPNGPTGDLRLPTFVLTHREPPEEPEGHVYTFVSDGVESLVKQAKAAAGDKDVSTSGADVPRQLIQAGLVDEIWIHLVPVLFGEGTRLYEAVGGEHVGLELIESVPMQAVTHLHYRVVR